MTDRQDQLTTMKQDIAARLRHVCVDWPDDLFDTMVSRLASITLRYHGTTAVPTYDRRSTDRLLTDLKAALERSEESRQPVDEPETEKS